MTDGVQYIGGKFESWERDYYIECTDLREGKYMAFVEFDWHEIIEQEDRVFNITSYGVGNSRFIDVSESMTKEAFLKQAFIAKLNMSKIGLHRIDMAEKGAHQIRRYLECNYPEGYIYIIIKNQDSEATYRETLEFDKFEKLKMCAPYSGKRFDVSVGPLNTEIVLIKAMRGANFAPGLSTQNVILGNKALKKIAIQENFKVNRIGEQVVIYKAWHENGFVTLYQNKSRNILYSEIVHYELEGMVIDGIEEEKTVFVKIGPGEEQLVKLINTENSQERKLQSTVMEKNAVYLDEEQQE